MDLLDLEYQLVDMNEDDRVIVIQNNMVILNHDREFLKCTEVEGKVQYLFVYDGVKYFLGNDVTEMDNCIRMSVTDIRNMMSYEYAMMISVAMQLARFYEANQYCGKCGSKMQVADNERAMVCECGNRAYPKVAPATITAIIDRATDSILLTKGIHMKDPNSFGLVAGFVEAGETFEECVYREVKEEVNLKIKNLKYYANQPWGFGDNIMIAFTAELDGSNEFVVQESELKKVWWQKRQDIMPVDRPLSVGHKMVQAFRRGEI